jgi:hypothetical protein
MARDTVEVKSAMISYLKSQSTVTTLISGSAEIREASWQGTEFKFPAIRVAVDLFPSINGCGPDKADFLLESFVAEKSSLDADTISSAMYKLFHKKPFISNGLKFSVVVVTKITKAQPSVYGWKSQLFLTTQVN